jgi:hypothetical protein
LVERACRGLAQERQHRLVNGEDAEPVGLPHCAHFIEGHMARAKRLCLLRGGLAGQHSCIRDRRVVDEHLEAAKLLADALRHGDNGVLICDV